MVTLYIVIGFIVFWLGLIVIVGVWEKRFVWVYVPLTEVPLEKHPAHSGYAHTVANTALAAGFTHWGAFGHRATNKLYCVRYDFYRAPTGDVLALVGYGKIAGLSVNTTLLYTNLTDGNLLLTLDNATGMEADLTNITQPVVKQGADFISLLAAHRIRTLRATSPPVPFGETNPLGELWTFRRQRVERLVEMGYAEFLDTERNLWHYTLKGAIVLVLRQNVLGLRSTGRTPSYRDPLRR